MDAQMTSRVGNGMTRCSRSEQLCQKRSHVASQATQAGRPTTVLYGNDTTRSSALPRATYRTVTCGRLQQQLPNA